MNGGSTLCRFIIRGTLVRAVLPALAGALVLAGCSGGNAAGTSAAGAPASAPASLSALQTCLKQHGVKVTPGQFGARPTASFSPGAFPTGAFPTRSPRPRASFARANSAAFKACAKYAPKGFARGANRAISSSALAAFKSCLISNGIKVTGSTASQILSGLRNSTGKARTALHTCQVLLQPTAPTPAANS